MKITLRYVHKDGTPCTPRECLAVVWNSWLFANQMQKAHEIANTGTDEECEKYLKELEESATRAHDLWEFSQ
jgi:hypothetical protein